MFFYEFLFTLSFFQNRTLKMKFIDFSKKESFSKKKSIKATVFYIHILQLLKNNFLTTLITKVILEILEMLQQGLKLKHMLIIYFSILWFLYVELIVYVKFLRLPATGIYKAILWGPCVLLNYVYFSFGNIWRFYCKLFLFFICNYLFKMINW